MQFSVNRSDGPVLSICTIGVVAERSQFSSQLDRSAVSSTAQTCVVHGDKAAAAAGCQNNPNCGISTVPLFAPLWAPL